jgi:hypothetical protein
MRQIKWVIFTLLLSSCNFPLTGNITATPNITQAYQTIQAEILTRQPLETNAALGTPFPTQETPNLFTLVPTNSALTPLSTLPVPTAVCDRVQPGNPIDVTIQDDMIIPPGESFVKTWRLINAGNCSWTSAYTLVWFSGEQFAKDRAFSLEQSVSPGNTIDVSVEMIAPKIPGTYQSNWMLQNAGGQLFGIGPAGKSPFWVRIIVPNVIIPTATRIPTATAIPTVLISGTIQLADGKGIILASKLQGNEQNSDLYLSNGNIRAQNNTILSAAIDYLPDYNGCFNLTKNVSEIKVNNGQNYPYFCFKDGANHIGWIQLLGKDPQGLDIELLVWNN